MLQVLESTEQTGSEKKLHNHTMLMCSNCSVCGLLKLSSFLLAFGIVLNFVSDTNETFSFICWHLLLYLSRFGIESLSEIILLFPILYVSVWDWTLEPLWPWTLFVFSVYLVLDLKVFLQLFLCCGLVKTGGCTAAELCGVLLQRPNF